MRRENEYFCVQTHKQKKIIKTQQKMKRKIMMFLSIVRGNLLSILKKQYQIYYLSAISNKFKLSYSITKKLIKEFQQISLKSSQNGLPYNKYSFLCFLTSVIRTRNTKMSESCPSQSQPTYFQQFTHQADKLTPFKIPAEEAVEKLAEKMKQAEGNEFEECLKQLSIFFKQGYATNFIKYTTVMRKAMNHFTKLSKALQNENHDISVEYRMIYTLSVLAELIRANPKVYFPFTRKFLNNLFLIDENCLILSQHRRDILAILGVLFENLSRQIKLIEKYQIVNTLKNAILTSYCLIDQIFTLKLYNKTIMNLVNKGVVFTTAEFHKYRVLDTVSHFISKNQVDLFLLKARLAIMCLQKPSESGEGAMIPES